MVTTTLARRADASKLFLLGFLTLFLELVFIRYLAGNIWNLGFFPNLVLIAVFIGMGVGFVSHHRWDDARSASYFQAAPFLILALVAFVTFKHPVVPGFNEWQGDFGGDLYFTAAPAHSQWRNAAMFGVWFVSIVAIFVLVSQRTAKLFRGFSPLEAYTLDISGSCAGIVCFMAMSWLRVPAYLWFAILIGLFVGSQPTGRRRATWLPVLPLVLAVYFAHQGDTRLLADRKYRGDVLVQWSPYQKVEYVNSEDYLHRVFVNGVNHQHMDTVEHIKAFSEGIPYSQPYHERAKQPQLPPYKTVLILGAGSGNDVAAALANGAEHVDAVEIDPVIAELGRQFHPARAYHDPRVTLTVTDGRAFLTRAQRKYDLIVFALTDSMVKVSPMAQLRLENYLFTEESVARAYRLLSDDGDVLFYNFYRQPWLRQKIEQMIHNVAGAYPKPIFQRGDFAMLVAGRHSSSATPTIVGDGTAVDTATDDWPFLYLQARGNPTLYLLAISGGALLLTGLMLIVQRKGPVTQGDGQGGLSTKIAFMLMGAAFLLLETKSVIQFSLLFGTTWINNSLVFLAVLLLVLAANWVAVGVKDRHLGIVYALLLASCLVTLAYPLAGLLSIESALARFVLASLMTFLPIFFANLIFSIVFRNQAVAEHLFGWNLIGATLGGVIEYTSLAVGYNKLSIVVAACYTAAYAALLAARRRGAGGSRGS